MFLTRLTQWAFSITLETPANTYYFKILLVHIQIDELKYFEFDVFLSALGQKRRLGISLRKEMRKSSFCVAVEKNYMELLT